MEGELRGRAATDLVRILFQRGPSGARFKGVSGDRPGGIKQLEIAAARGRYLRPFAKIILALAYLREKNTALGRIQLLELIAEFPQNPLFVSELAKIDASLPATAAVIAFGPGP